ncbi:Pyruvate dehydrogenase E1 component [Maioricimonas rarisocia]|uniref:Pyruvate dehydrogenase E1 component n=1 Tax=Maioricimonas rarisocia TaxID=2528026 RepID=A0A517ZA11_9PLAN|nr:pyruvate dehydrogenase (acetyl-transferring), homodimeric type [Maioricimonas rarisocia]QDU39326.1 Pyruvate dehydrogenase E1 component [Maioricimonas rarisocia]
MSVEPVVDGSVHGIDPLELEEWYESLEDVLHRYGAERTQQLLVQLQERAYHRGVMIPFHATTPYINSIHVGDQPRYPGNLEIERRIKSIIRWNAMAMVVRANTATNVGGHISTFASSATLYEVAFNHFFHARTKDHPGDMVYFQGHASPGMYSRAFVEGRLDEERLKNFRQEVPRGSGLSSYPHPWLMEDFWQFPTVSMGLGPICSIYHARFLRYLQHRGLIDTSQSHVWCFVGDGEVDEPETLGALTLAARENLDNLIWVVNCNLQRLDGPVRGNGKIIQELEGAFRGAGWNCLKVIWGRDWDSLLAHDVNGKLVKRMGEIVDGQFQKYSVSDGAYIREHFFGADPELAEMVDHLSDEQLRKMRRGGHEPEKVYAAFKAAHEHTGAPTVILAKTIKGYGLGEAGEGRNIAHNQKKINLEELRQFRDRFNIPIADDQLESMPFYRPPADSEEMVYLHQRREQLGGFVPERRPTDETLDIPALEDKSFARQMRGTGDKGTASTTQAYSAILMGLMKTKTLGERIVPIIPDEARTFGMEGFFSSFGIYSSKGQQYEPVDRDQMMYYKEAKDGQVLEEGINEAGAMSSFIAAGTAYANLGIQMVPFYIYYSMFGFQRVGDLIWCAADSRVKGFLVGGTSGRTTLNGEGLQHEDGHSQLVATTVPNLVAYDPAFAYELAIIMQDGLRRMYVDNECIFYYLSVYNEQYEMPAMPEREGIVEGVLKGMYRLTDTPSGDGQQVRPQLFGSGTILPQVLKAQTMLQERYGIGTDVWSVTSYSELCREAMKTSRWNRLHPDQEQKKSYLEQSLSGIDGPFIAASDNVRLVPDQIREWIPGDYVVLGTDGFGRSDTREVLRRHFEIDPECTVYATLHALAEQGQFDKARLPQVLEELGIDPEKINPLIA